MASVRLADYRPAPCLIAHTELQVCLYADHTLVACTLRLEPNPVATPGPLWLRERARHKDPAEEKMPSASTRRGWAGK